MRIDQQSGSIFRSPRPSSHRPHLAAPRGVFVLGMVLLIVAVIAAGSGSASAKPSTSAPSHSATGTAIQVGGICALTGPTPIPESCDAAKAYFDYVNSRGGVDGHPIKYTIEDEAGNVNTSSEVATRLVDQTHVVAIVGSDDSYACGTSNKLFASSKTYVLDGLGIDAACWDTPYDTPVNNGPYFGYAVTSYFLAKVLHKDNICAMVANISSAIPVTNNEFKILDALIGQHVKEILWTPGQNLTPLVTDVTADNCKAFIMVGDTATFTSIMRTAQVEGKATGAITWMGLTTGYTLQAQQNLTAVKGYWINSELFPWSLTSPKTSLFKTLQKKYGFTLDSSAETGFLAAEIFVNAIKGIKGPITRTSVGHALRALKKVSTGGLTAKSFSWGKFNTSSMFMQLENGKWVPYGGSDGKWYSVPITAAQVHSIVTGVPVGS